MTIDEGTKIGPYRIVRMLGQGGMGAVFAALHELIGRKVAIKVLHAAYASDAEFIQRFFNEARAVNIVDHPGIVQISDYGLLTDGTAYIVMEFLKGETLGQRLRSAGSGLPIADVVHLAWQVADSLLAAHGKGIIHRDLKPDNIMVVPDPHMPSGERTKLLDFGIAKLADALVTQTGHTETGTVLGTPSYMSPEQCAGASGVDAKSDVYSLGCVIYHMLAGRPPFVAEGAGAIIGMQQFVEPEPLAGLTPAAPLELVTLTHRLLVKRRDDRLPMQEVVARLDMLGRHFRMLDRPAEVAAKTEPNAGSSSSGLAVPRVTQPAASISTLGASVAESLQRPPKSLRLPIVLGSVGAALTIMAVLYGLIGRKPYQASNSASEKIPVSPTAASTSRQPLERTQFPAGLSPMALAPPTRESRPKETVAVVATPPPSSVGPPGSPKQLPPAQKQQTAPSKGQRNPSSRPLTQPNAVVGVTTSSGTLPVAPSAEPRASSVAQKIRIAEAYLQEKNWREALRSATSSAAWESNPAANRIVGISACHMRDLRHAQEAYERLMGSAQSEVASACRSTDAPLLESGVLAAEDHLAFRRWTAALRAAQGDDENRVRTVRAWRVIGIAGCSLRQTKTAEQALTHLDGIFRRQVVRACQEVGVTLSGQPAVSSEAAEKAVDLAWTYLRSHNLALAMSAAQDAIRGGRPEGWTVFGLVNCGIGDIPQSRIAYANAPPKGRLRIERFCRERSIDLGNDGESSAGQTALRAKGTSRR